MPVKYCPNCGQPPDLPARYCSICGALLPATEEAEDSSSLLSARQPQAFRDEDPDSDSAELERDQSEATEPRYFVDAGILTAMFSCAFKNAPMDTQFLIVRDKATGREQALPLYCIYSLEGLEVVNSGKVEFLLPGQFLQSLEMNFEDPLAEEVVDAYLKTRQGPTLRIEVLVSYDPKLLDSSSVEMPGRWENGDVISEDAGRKVTEEGRIVALTGRSMLSGKAMKRNLQRYIDSYSKYCVPDPCKTKEEHEHTLDRLRECLEAIPDGFEAHLHCMAFYWPGDGPLLRTRLKVEDGQVRRIAAAAPGARARRPSIDERDILPFIGRSPRIAVAQAGHARSSSVQFRCMESSAHGGTEVKSRAPAAEEQSFARPGTAFRASGPAPPATARGATGNSQFKAAPDEAGGADVSFQKMQEPNQKAFTFLVPEGWQISGGVFMVNADQVNGPGNTLSPKCDFTVKSDDRGKVMIRWVPSWNFGDLTFAPAGGFFPPGSWYQGMPVRLMVSPKQFLYEMLCAERPQGSDLKIVSEDPMAEITAEFERQAAQVNASLQQMGLYPITFASHSLLVEYAEGGERFLEEVTTTIADNRQGAFMWTNENTTMLRAPVAACDVWFPVLNRIHASREVNQQWLAAVERASGQRAKEALMIQQKINAAAASAMASRQRTTDYINQVAKEIADSRRSVTDNLQQQADDYWATPSGGSDGGPPDGGGDDIPQG